MGPHDWLKENWFTLLQAIGIIGALIFTGISLQVDARVRRVQNLLSFTKHHREIWTGIYEHPDLLRLLLTDETAVFGPPTVNEELFVTFVILHLNTVYQEMKRRMFVAPEGIVRDIRSFFSRPIPLAVWRKAKALQDQDFVRFVEGALQD